jgi:hypothetical protein
MMDDFNELLNDPILGPILRELQARAQQDEAVRQRLEAHEQRLHASWQRGSPVRAELPGEEASCWATPCRRPSACSSG